MIAISEAESRVMQVLWDRGPSTAEDVVAALAAVEDWREATVKTLLNRLLKKHAIEAEQEGRRYRYTARLKQSEWVLQESGGLVDRLFGGRVAPLVAHFSQHGRLSKSDIDELRRLIEEIDGDA